MKKWIIIGIGILGMLSLTAFAKAPDKLPTIVDIQSYEIAAIINKNTSEKELEDLKAFFSEKDIELLIKKIEYNDQNELTSLSIVLKKGNLKSQYSSSSNMPISEIKLGCKNGKLYISHSGMPDVVTWGNPSGGSYPKIDMDSIMKKHSFAFDFNFDEVSDSLFFKGNFDVKKLKDQIMKSFSFQQDEDSNFTFNGQQTGLFSNFGNQKFNFVDNPDIEKLIIIDGEESNFETLDNLAKSNQLAEVDFLKPQTAISIYGDKAKDGAIIATTKK